jgi:hypothetical protein
VLATLAEDPNVRATLNSGGGSAAAQRSARTGRAAQAAYLGDRLAR